MPQKRKEYAAPQVEKREKLAEVARFATTTSGATMIKGGCFKQERAK
jgi:hypothetical protein